MESSPNCDGSFCRAMTEPLDHPLEIQVNGETREFAVGLTVEGLILALDLQPSRVAIEVNRNVVRRSQWAATTLHEGDRVEIVHFVGGGSDIMQSVPGAVATVD